MTSQTSKSRSGKFAVIAMSCFMALVLAACGGTDGDVGSSSPGPDYKAKLADAPAKLAALYSQDNQLLEGGAGAFTAEVERLKGYPIVVNKWASWCGPCRAEFPYFQNLAAELGTEVAFIGVNANDNEDAAATFLRDNPLPYPSYSDPDENISSSVIKAPIAYPSTAYYDADGNLVATHQGVYSSESDLLEDIKQVAPDVVAAAR